MKELFISSPGRGAAALALASVLVGTPALAFAKTQSTPPLTREQVRQELAVLESVGYDPARGEDANYPDDLMNAEQRLARKRQEARQQ